MAEDFPRNGGDSPLEPTIGPPTMSPSILKWGAVIIGLIVVFGIVSFGRGIYTDLLWFDSLGFRSIFLTVTVTRLALFAIGALTTGVILGVSLRLAHLHSAGEVNLPIPEEVVPTLRRAVLWGAVIVVVILSLIFGSVLAARWELFLRFANSVPFNQVDPVYGQDLGFYIFNLPVYSFVQGWVLGLGIVALLTTVGLNFVNYSLRGMSFSLTGARLAHISVIAAVIMLTMAAGHWIDRWALVLSEDGAVFGATFADLNARKPALLIMTIIAAAAAILIAVNVYLRELRIVIGAVVLWVVLGLVLNSAWPAVVQQFSVTPNEFVKESPFIARNIEFTRQAFALHRIEEEFYPAETVLSSEIIEDNLKTVNNIRLWDYRPLSSVYRQIQLIRPYYDFKDADVDRYYIDGEYRQVLLSAREVAPEKLGPEDQTWVNTRLSYTHGIGIAMSTAPELMREG